ncbi:MAG: hypothetical protein FWF02_10915 [Micrococcales bacterium]|nr:hypothetical protein [Micrococcales bacterium]MCL2668197.1 hypothetical protein [Micrococcales bacterium]
MPTPAGTGPGWSTRPADRFDNQQAARTFHRPQPGQERRGRLDQVVRPPVGERRDVDETARSL